MTYYKCPGCGAEKLEGQEIGCIERFACGTRHNDDAWRDIQYASEWEYPKLCIQNQLKVKEEENDKLNKELKEAIQGRDYYQIIALEVEANFCLKHVPLQDDEAMPCPCCENKELKATINKLPCYEDTKQPFIPGLDNAYIIRWGSGDNQPRWVIEEVSSCGSWKENLWFSCSSGIWHANRIVTRIPHKFIEFYEEFYSTKDAAKISKYKMKR